jgi:serine/threonine-protein kinase
MDEWEPRALPLTNGAILPFFSPDGRWIAFFRGGNLEKMLVSGGPSQIICRAGPYTGRWSDDGTILFGDWPSVGLWRVPADGGTPQPIIRPSEGGGTRYFWPDPLPGGKGILFTIFDAGGASVAVVPPGAATPRILVESGSQARYVPTGHLMYVAASRLVAVPFDLDRLEVRGRAALVLDDINETALIPYGVSENGVFVYQTSSSLDSDVVWKDRQGVTTPVGWPARQYGGFPTLSPDGGRLSVQILDGVTRNIWTGRIANEPLTRLTFGNDDVNGPWSRDGKHLFYSAGQHGKHRIHSIATDGSGKAERLADGSNSQFPRSVSPSGDTILIDDLDPETGRDIWELSVSRKESKPLIKTPFIEGGPEFSPRGHWIAYQQSDESGRVEVYVQAYPGPGAKRRVSEGGANPFWSRTGRDLFYRTPTALFSVSIPDGDDLRPGPPVRVLALTPFDEAVVAGSPDDQRFLMVQARPSSQLNLVENFFDELKRLAPAN